MNVYPICISINSFWYTSGSEGVYTKTIDVYFIWLIIHCFSRNGPIAFTNDEKYFKTLYNYKSGHNELVRNIKDSLLSFFIHHPSTFYIPFPQGRYGNHLEFVLPWVLFQTIFSWVLFFSYYRYVFFLLYGFTFSLHTVQKIQENI